jgi:hypothetical protein
LTPQQQRQQHGSQLTRLLLACSECRTLLLHLIQSFYSSWVVVRWLLLVLLLLQTTSAALQPVLPKSGLVVSEKGGLSELLCKPKILPLKSATLKRLEALQVCAGPASFTAL